MGRRFAYLQRSSSQTVGFSALAHSRRPVLPGPAPCDSARRHQVRVWDVESSRTVLTLHHGRWARPTSAPCATTGPAGRPGQRARRQRGSPVVGHGPAGGGEHKAAIAARGLLSDSAHCMPAIRLIPACLSAHRSVRWVQGAAVERPDTDKIWGLLVRAPRSPSSRHASAPPLVPCTQLSFRCLSLPARCLLTALPWPSTACAVAAVAGWEARIGLVRPHHRHMAG